MRPPKITVLCALSFLVATGCTSVARGTTQQTPTPTATVSATASLDVTSTFTCRLPVISPYNPGVPPGGWITFPGGLFERDPASDANRLQAHVPSYDRAIRAWLPVENRNVSPSGDRYILTNDSSLPDAGGFYLVDVKTGARRLVLRDGPPQAPGSWTVVEFADAGVYLWSAGMLTVPGLWLLDPGTGKVRLIDGSHYWRMMGNGVAWALDPEPGPGSSQKEGVFRLVDVVVRVIDGEGEGPGGHWNNPVGSEIAYHLLKAILRSAKARAQYRYPAAISAKRARPENRESVPARRLL